MVIKLSILLLTMIVIEGAMQAPSGLRRALLEQTIRQRTGSVESENIEEVENARVTPLSPMTPVQCLQCYDTHSAIPIESDLASSVRYGKPSITTNAQKFLHALDNNYSNELNRYINKTFVNAKYEGNHGKQPPVIRALAKGCLAAFEALIDFSWIDDGVKQRIDLTIPDEEMMTVAMYVALYEMKHKDLPARILADRKIVLERTIPYDKKKRNALWHVINRKTKSFESARYRDMLFKIDALKRFGVSSTDKDSDGVSALDLAVSVYGHDSDVVMVLNR